MRKSERERGRVRERESEKDRLGDNNRRRKCEREREEGIQKERNTICIMLIIQGGGREDIENE